jgi:transcription antitermination factor NusG
MAVACINDISTLPTDWFAAQVWTGRERAAALQLHSRGYEVCLPCYHENRRWSDRVKKVERALFPGYVFCRVTDDALGKVITTPGVIRLVGDGHHPIPLPCDEIDTIRRIAASDVAARPWAFVRAGDPVRINSGPLRGTEGVVLRTTHGDRLVVSIAMLQRSVALEISRDWISMSPATMVSAVECQPVRTLSAVIPERSQPNVAGARPATCGVLHPSAE